VPANVAATPSLGTSSAEALGLLLLAACGGQRREIDRLHRRASRVGVTNRELVAERDELKQRNEDPNRRLGLDSTNSSKPPSCDRLKRKRRTARSPERERWKRLGRRPGKQKGAPGHHPGADDEAGPGDRVAAGDHRAQRRGRPGGVLFLRMGIRDRTRPR
jgi:hypothetical protein